MTKNTLRIMAGFETRLNTLIRKEVCACGYEENILEADLYRGLIIKWLEVQIEKLQQSEGKQ